jgi:hypothetical protein
MSEDTSIVPAQSHAPALLRPIANLEAIIGAQQEMVSVLNRLLKPERDYGKPPNTDREILYKAGAESVCNAFGVFTDYEILDQEIDHMVEVPWVKRKKNWRNRHQGDREFTWSEEHGSSLGLYRYVIKCRLIHRHSGEVVGTGVGSCSTLESKYIDRPRDTENTIIKMAQKRAHVAAVLTTFGLSDRFTQDLEEEAAGEAPSSAAPAQGNGAPKQVKGYAAYMRDLGVTPDQQSAFEKACKSAGRRAPEVTAEAQSRGIESYGGLMGIIAEAATAPAPQAEPEKPKAAPKKGEIPEDVKAFYGTLQLTVSQVQEFKTVCDSRGLDPVEVARAAKAEAVATADDLIAFANGYQAGVTA